MTAVAPTRRINHGRGHSYLLDGEKADGITWVLGNGVPKPALVNWAARESAGYAVDHWDELQTVGASERLRRIERARFENLKGASVRGTDVHELALKLSHGEEVNVPEHLTGHVDSYLKFVEQWEPEEVLTETVVGNRKFRYMGTLDTVAQLNDGNLWLLDWKTSASGIYPESALQLAAYRYAEFALGPDAIEQPMPLVTRTGCVWLRADGYELIPVTANPDTFRIFLYAQQVARFTDTNRDHYVGQAVQPVAA